MSLLTLVIQGSQSRCWCALALRRTYMEWKVIELDSYIYVALWSEIASDSAKV